MADNSSDESHIPEYNRNAPGRYFRFFSVFLILLGPLFIFLLGPMTCTQHCVELPYMFTPEGATEKHRIPDFTLRNQRNEIFTQDSLRGYIHVADFIFTTCPGICKRLSKEMAELQEKILEVPEVRLVSFTVDPEIDTVETLAAYADRYEAQYPHWTFLTGPKEPLYQVIKEGYKAPVYETPEGEERITHSPMFFLVDKDLHVRGFYNMLHDTSYKTLLEEIDALRCQYRNNP